MRFFIRMNVCNCIIIIPFTVANANGCERYNRKCACVTFFPISISSFSTDNFVEINENGFDVIIRIATDIGFVWYCISVDCVEQFSHSHGFCVQSNVSSPSSSMHWPRTVYRCYVIRTSEENGECVRVCGCERIWMNEKAKWNGIFITEYICINSLLFLLHQASISKLERSN